MANLKGFKNGGDASGLHKMESGFLHTADSLAGGKRGTFKSEFGPPGDPTVKAAAAKDSSILGSAPKNLLGDFTDRGSQKKAGSK